MTDKVWTASDIKMGALRLKKVDDSGNISVMQGYEYTDGNGDVIEDLPKKTITSTLYWGDLPDDMKSALIKIFSYTKNKALITEGMD